MKRILSIVILSVLLISCAETPVERTHYYLLNTTVLDKSKQVSINSNNQHLITIEQVVLPQYLNQASIAMLIDQNQLHYARYHVWAEDLSSAITKQLKQVIAQQNSVPSATKVIVEIDHFYPTEQSEVILAGHYWLKKSNTDPQLVNFSFKQGLKADGYAQAVLQMQQLVVLLADDIIEQSKL